MDIFDIVFEIFQKNPEYFQGILGQICESISEVTY